ncbi:MAG: hypothetical protein ACLGI6_16200, partial [Gammaproteobacteria bacterium]
NNVVESYVAQLGEATSADVILVPHFVRTIAAISAEEIEKYGCRYPVDRPHIADLISIVAHSGITGRHEAIQNADIRIRIDFRKPDGATIRLAFKSIPSLPSSTTLDGFVNGKDASASRTLFAELSTWVKVLPAPTRIIKTDCF